MKKIKLGVFPGDGIGQDVMNAVLPIFDILKLNDFDLIEGQIGWECWKENGDPIPQETWDIIRESDACLLGAITSKPLEEAERELRQELQGQNIKYVSPVIQLRQKLNLFANVRPVFDLSNEKKYNFVIIRENTEGLYSGLDFLNIPFSIQEEIHKNPKWAKTNLNSAACTIRLQTKEGLLRLFNFAFSYAQEHNYRKVTFADKPNVMRESGLFAKKILEEVSSQYPDIKHEILNIDAIALWLVKRPEQFQVIVAENMFGDILSDLGAGIMGGLGLAPSANIGYDYAYFEPVHGSAPSYVGFNKANPIAMFQTVALMLKHFDFYKEALFLEKCIQDVISENRHLTPDLGGTATTTELSGEILTRLRKYI